MDDDFHQRGMRGEKDDDDDNEEMIKTSMNE